MHHQASPNPLSMETGPLREQLSLLLKQTFGSRAEMKQVKIGNQHLDYLVLLVQLNSPSLEVVIKLAGPQAPYPCPFDRTAVIHHLVTKNTSIPMPKTFAVDVTYQKWPWRYMIKAHMPGIEWATARQQMNPQQLASAYRQIGIAVAQLHLIQFPKFGEIDVDGRGENGRFYLKALQKRATSSIKNNRLQEYFFSVLHHYAYLFDDIQTANLCHEDLHCYNILFEHRQNQWHLSTILDFDKAWAGHRETDLARLDLWTDMTNKEFWQAYQAIYPITKRYKQRRPIYQLLWCLEYARPTEKHLADTQQVCKELGFPIIEGFE